MPRNQWRRLFGRPLTQRAKGIQCGDAQSLYTYLDPIDRGVVISTQTFPIVFPCRRDSLTPISASIPTLGAANCWNAVTPNGSFVYVSNAGSSTISGFSIGGTGVLTPVPGTIVGTNPAGSGNLDVAISADGKFLYSLNSAGGTIGAFALNAVGR